MAGSCCGFVREAKRGAGLKRDEFARGVWQGTGPFARVTRGALMPVSWMVTAASSARTALYRLGMLQPQRLATPIVSIGNLRVGGSGQTPLVIWLVEKLRAAGGNVAVVSRGYGRGHDALTVFTADTTSPETLTAVAPCCSGYEHVHVRADGRTELRPPRAGAAHEAVLVAVQLLEDLADLVPSGLHHDLFTEFARFALISHLIQFLLGLHSGLLFFLKDKLVPIMQLLGHVSAVCWSVSHLEGGVDLWLEHLSSTLWVDDALLLKLFLLSLKQLNSVNL